MSSKLLNKSWLYKTEPKYKKRKKKVTSRAKRFTKKLNANLPASEKWFQELFNKENLELAVLYNEYFFGYYPDVIDTQLKVIIEIDGSIHNTLEQQLIDTKKDVVYRKKGYSVIRVKAFDINSYNACINDLKYLIKSYPHQYENSRRVYKARQHTNNKLKDKPYRLICIKCMKNVVLNIKLKLCNECIISLNESALNLT